MRYAEARPLIRDGDVVLFESKGPVAAAIRWGTRSAYSHAALVAWWGDDLILLESREGKGTRAVRLSDAVAAKGSSLWLYTAADRYADDLDRGTVVAAARARLGAPYGWGAIVRDVLGRLPLLALALRRSLASLDDDRAARSRVKCSTLVALAYRAGGVDLVPQLSDDSTDPGDIARSLALRCVGPLTP